METGPVLPVVSAPKKPENDIPRDVLPKYISPNAADIHTGPEIAVSKAEIKLPKYFFERVRGDAIKNTYSHIKDGLLLIGEIKSGKKSLEFTKDKDNLKIDFKLLKKIKSVDPDNETLLAEIKRLVNYQEAEYDLGDLKSKIDSYPEIIALKNSDKPKEQKEKEYENLVSDLMGHEIRNIFRQNIIAGQPAEIAMHLLAIVRDGQAKLADRKGENLPGNVSASDEKKETIGPTPETAAQRPLAEENDEEKLKKLDQKIQSKEFTDEEREFFDEMIQKYPGDLQKAKEKIEDAGRTVDERWAEAVRTSYINDRKRAGLDKKRWGTNIPLTPEKAEIFEKYLELKLPVGLPPKKTEAPEVVESSAEEIKENIFTSEQSSELLALIKELAKIQDQIEPTEMPEIIEKIIREDFISQGIFSEDDFSKAFEHVTKQLKKINRTK